MTQQWGYGGQPAGNQQWGRAGTPLWGPPTAAPQWGQPAAVQWPQPPGAPAWGQPAGWGQQRSAGYPGSPAPGPAYPGGRPPRRRSFGGVLFGLALVIGVAIFALTLVNYLGGDDSETASPGRPTTTRPTSNPTTDPAPVTPQTYDPPPLPEPETYQEAATWLEDNAAYPQTTQIPTECVVGDIDITKASVSQLSNHFNELTGCLIRVWDPPLRAAGFKLPRPPVTVYNEPITTGCGSLDDVNAVYCAADQRIYYAKPLYRIFPPEQQQARFVAESILAHEFGHAIQARTGILISLMAFKQEASAKEARELQRRLEVQADCLSGMFTGAVGPASGLSPAELTNLQDVTYNLGDDVLSNGAETDGEHGSGRARQRWFATGQETNLIGTCNTYVVPASQVR